MVWIKLCSHSMLPGAEGLCGDIINAESTAAAYLCSDGSAVETSAPSDFQPFVQVPTGISTTPVVASEPEAEIAIDEALPLENPKKAKR